MFAFPHGVRVATREEADANAIPVVTSFVLTAADKSRMYGACIVFYEKLPSHVVSAFIEEANDGNANGGPGGPGKGQDAACAGADTASGVVEEPEAKKVATDAAPATPPPPEAHAPEAICLLSRVAVFDALMECCRQLFRMRISSDGPLPASELAALLAAPMPSFGLRAEVPLGNIRVPVATPRANELPHTMAGRDFLLLFQCLDINNVIMLWALLLAEQKVALQGRMPHVLTMAAETLSALLFPFSWQHVYIPILPERLLDILQAPVPFLIGIDEEVLALAEKDGMIPDDVVQVDLDENAVYCDQSLAACMHLPQKQYAKLYKAVAPFCRPANTNSGGDGNAASAFPMAPPPDADDAVAQGSQQPLSEWSDEAVSDAIRTIKAAFLRFFVSVMLRYQELMVVPPSEIKLPAATDFFDYRRWQKSFSLPQGAEWLEMFAGSQSFTQFFEQRLAPRDVPELEVCFFNESIDAKLMRSVRTKLFAHHSTPLLTTGTMPSGGYAGHLVPPAARTVYNASMIAARPTRSQQQVALLLVLGSGIQEAGTGGGAAPAPGGAVGGGIASGLQATLKQEFARNLLWSRVDVGAALLLHVCPWASAASAHHRAMRSMMQWQSAQQPTAGLDGASQPPATLEALAVRDTMLDAMRYASDAAYKRQLHDALRRSLRELAAAGGGDIPLCVLAHGFGSVLAFDFFVELQGREVAAAAAAPADASASALTPLERGQTLAFLCTLGSPLPLLVAAQQGAGSAISEGALRVPSPHVLARWPHLRGGWSNFYHRSDATGCSLLPTNKGVTLEAECRRKAKGEAAGSAQTGYFDDLVDCVRPIAQALSHVWQDANRTSKAFVRLPA